MAPKRSFVWDFFKRTTSDKVRCNLCSQDLSAKGCTTSNMARHMRLKHPIININESRERITDSSEVGPIEYPVNNEEVVLESASSATVPESQTRQTKITGYASRPLNVNKRRKIDEQILKMIVKEYHSFNIVEGKEFKKLCTMLNSSYEVPSRKTISNSLLNAQFNETLEYVRKEIRDNCTYICLTTDGWTSLKNENYMAVMAHYIRDESLELNSFLLSSFKFVGQHTADNIATQLKAILSEWDIQNKIVACVTDNAANVTKAVQLCNWWHVPCFAHSLNLIVQASLNEINQTRTKVKSIVEYFKRSPQVLHKFHSIQKQMGFQLLTLKQDCPTRWNSTFDMFKRILKSKEPLQSTLAILNQESLPRLDNEDWYIIEKSCEILECFDEVTREISSEKHVTLSKIVIFSKALLNRCLQLSQEKYQNEKIAALMEKLTEEVRNRMFKKYHSLSIIWEATFLDPRFKRQGFPDDVQFKETKEAIIKKCCKIHSHKTNSNQNLGTEPSISNTTLQTGTPSNSIWSSFDQATENLVQKSSSGTSNPTAASIAEVDKYIMMPLLPRVQNPLDWWKENKEIFPTLFGIMKRRLCIPATSVPSERIFSKQGQTISENRTRLSSEKVSKIMFLNSNLE